MLNDNFDMLWIKVFGDINTGDITDGSITDAKLSKSVVSSITSKVGIDTFNTTISNVNQTISLKASQQGLDNLGNRVTTAEGEISVQAGQIASKVDVNGVKSTITQSSSEVQTAFNGAAGKFVVKNGNLELQNASGTNVMWVDTNGDLTTNKLHVYGANNNVLVDGTGHKGIDLNSTDGGDCYVQFNNGNYNSRIQASINSPNALVLRGSGGVQVEYGMYLNNYVECHGVNGHPNLPLELNRTAGNGQTIVCDGTGSGTGGSLQAGDLYLINGANLGSLSVRGSKNCLVETKDFGERLMNSYETPGYYFGDLGYGVINENGECVVYVDEIVKECLNMNIKYHVFPSVYHGRIDRIERYKEYFTVYGEAGTEFSWELKGKRLNYETNRLDVINLVDDITRFKTAPLDLIENTTSNIETTGRILNSLSTTESINSTDKILNACIMDNLTNILLGV